MDPTTIKGARAEAVPHTLAGFLKAARARLTPEAAGLPVAARTGGRRVRGLRRSEVATLAGMSVDYYTRMEQGRVRSASEAVATGLAEALRLDVTERAYLFDLLSTHPTRTLTASPMKVRATIREFITALPDRPAYVSGVGMEVLAMNPLATALIADLSHRRGNGRSIAHWTFLDPAARDHYVEWERVAADVTSTLRRHSLDHPDDASLQRLIGELSTKCPEFRQWWADHRVFELAHGVKKLSHPVVGRLDLHYEVFPVAGSPGQQLIVYQAPPGSPAEESLRILASWAAGAVH